MSVNEALFVGALRTQDAIRKGVGMSLGFVADRWESAKNDERGEGMVGFMLVILLVIAIFVVVRPILLEEFRGEAENIDLDISQTDPVADGDGN